MMSTQIGCLHQSKTLTRPAKKKNSLAWSRNADSATMMTTRLGTPQVLFEERERISVCVYVRVYGHSHQQCCCFAALPPYLPNAVVISHTDCATAFIVDGAW